MPGLVRLIVGGALLLFGAFLVLTLNQSLNNTILGAVLSLVGSIVFTMGAFAHRESEDS
jgi:uncharacterized MnhB-related membrane protein